MSFVFIFCLYTKCYWDRLISFLIYPDSAGCLLFLHYRSWSVSFLRLVCRYVETMVSGVCYRRIAGRCNLSDRWLHVFLCPISSGWSSLTTNNAVIYVEFRETPQKCILSWMRISNIRWKCELIPFSRRFDKENTLNKTLNLYPVYINFYIGSFPYWNGGKNDCLEKNTFEVYIN